MTFFVNEKSVCQKSWLLCHGSEKQGSGNNLFLENHHLLDKY